MGITISGERYGVSTEGSSTSTPYRCRNARVLTLIICDYTVVLMHLISRQN